MKKLFFTLCALCLCGTMWGVPNVTNTDYYKDANRPTDESGEVYVDPTTQISFYVSNGNAVLTYSVYTDGSNRPSSSNWTSYTFSGTFSIPEYVSDGTNQYPVTTIGNYAFFYDTGLNGELTIPSYITSIGICAFEGAQFTSVVVEEGTTDLANGNNQLYGGAFYGSTTITSVTINRNIGSGRSYDGIYRVSPFDNLSALTTVSLGAGVTNVVHDLFYDCSAITTVYCYATSVPAIEQQAFGSITKADCTLHVYESLVSEFQADTRYDETHTISYGWADQFSNIVSMDDPDVEVGTFKDTVTGLYFKDYDGTYVSIIANELGTYSNENLVDYEGELAYLAVGAKTIPQYVYDEDGNVYPVDRIDTEAFYGAEIEGHLVIPAYIVQMGTSAFEDCTGLTAVTYEYSETPLTEEDEGDSSQAIGMSFQGCTNIETVNMFRDFTMQSATRHVAPFEYLNVKVANIGPHVTTIPAFMFRNCGLTTVNCYALEVPATRYDPFSSVSTDSFVINVPAGLKDTYANTQFAYSSYTTYTTWGEMFTIQDMSNAFAITTHDNGETAYATFYNSASDVELFDDGTDTELTAYVAYQLDEESDGLYIEIAEIGNYVPAGTGVIVETEKAGTYLAIATGNTTSFTETNDLYGSDTADTTVGPNDGGSYYFYLLSSNNGNVGFYWGATGGGAFTCQAHRAYLAIPMGEIDDEDGNGSNGISIRKGSGEDTTGISAVESASEKAVSGIYTIQGVRVSNMNQPGLYIVDGRKVLVK